MQPHEMNGSNASSIAADLERERADLAQSIVGLRERLSVDALAGDAINYARQNLGQYAKALDGAVRANPLAAVMTGVGIAWLVLGRKSSEKPEQLLAGTKFEAFSRWEDEGGPVSSMPDPTDAWIVEADSMRDRARRALARIDSSSLMPTLDAARDRAEVLIQLARGRRMAMLRGLEGMTEAAQERILAARERAYTARNTVLHRGGRLIEDQPIVAGAIGMAIGAAVGSMLPGTNIENRVFGAERDRLLAEAQRALRVELNRATEAGSELANTVADGIKDTAVKLVSEVAG